MSCFSRSGAGMKFSSESIDSTAERRCSRNVQCVYICVLGPTVSQSLTSSINIKMLSY